MESPLTGLSSGVALALPVVVTYAEGVAVSLLK
ncbi:hypothetical protein J2790_001902 [Paenarthrobacter nicotinovorans]|nr:hypothetical protein [Paenarthrobacter nicotinovorans]